MKSNCREVVSHRHATSELLVGYTALRICRVSSLANRDDLRKPCNLITVTEREPVRAHWHASFFADGMARSVTLAGANADSPTGIA